ncbi:MAG: hypothetical protein Q7J68_07585, partial [Thermoplasmata archaeon]|nr:hypothetical protein [Thermoplasmata archaeon]
MHESMSENGQKNHCSEDNGSIISQITKEPYYKTDTFELYLSDCIEFLSQLPEDSVDMIFADPPYNLSNGGFSCHAGKRVSVN